MKDIKIAIVIPVYNDWENLPALFERLERSLSDRCGEVGIFVVNDCSSADPFAFIQECRRRSFTAISRVVQITLNRNMGHQGAIVIGICHVLKQERVDGIVIMDADGEDRPEDISLLIEMMEKTKRSSASTDRCSGTMMMRPTGYCMQNSSMCAIFH